MTIPRFVRFELVNGGAMYVQITDIVRISLVHQGVFNDGSVVVGRCWVTCKVESEKTQVFGVVGDPDDVAKALVS